MIANGIDPDSPQAQARMRSNGPRPDGESSRAMDDAARRARGEARMAADAAGNTSGRQEYIENLINDYL